MATRLSIQLSPQASAALAELIQPHAEVNHAEIHQNGGRMSRVSIQLSPQALAGIIQPHALPSAIPEGEVDCSRLPTRMSIQLPPQASAALTEMLESRDLPAHPPPYHRMSTRMSIQMSPQALAELLQPSTSSDMPPSYNTLYPALYATKASSEPYIVSLEYPPDNEPLPCTSFPRFSNDMGAYPGPPFYVVTFENDDEMTLSESPFTAPIQGKTGCCASIRSRRGLVILIPLLLLVICILVTLTVVFTRHHP